MSDLIAQSHHAVPMRRLVYAWEGEVEGLHSRINDLVAALMNARPIVKGAIAEDGEDSIASRALGRIDAALRAAGIHETEETQ